MVAHRRSHCSVGCVLVEPASWAVSAPPHAFIVGIKELPEHPVALHHRHIYFAHCYKHQAGWQQLLGRFQSGGGELLDLEFLQDNSGRRVAAFGYMAGFVGAAIGLDIWARRQLGQPCASLEPYACEADMVAHVSQQLALARNGAGAAAAAVAVDGRRAPGSACAAAHVRARARPQRVVGGRASTSWARSGDAAAGPSHWRAHRAWPSASIAVASASCGFRTLAGCRLTLPRVRCCFAASRSCSGICEKPLLAAHFLFCSIGRAERRSARGPRTAHRRYSDILVNCIYLSGPIAPFLTIEILRKPHALSVLVDVSCDVSNAHNPLPMVSRTTTFARPTFTLGPELSSSAVDVVAIDHLPTLLPLESSERFSRDLLPTMRELRDYTTSSVWQRARQLFRDKCAAAAAADTDGAHVG